MIINAGIKNVIYWDNGKIKKASVAKWQKDWQKKDMIDDMEVYGVKYKK